MKTITFLISTVGLLQLFSCTGQTTKTKLVGSVFVSCEEDIDNTSCKCATDSKKTYENKLLLVNDSVFIEIWELGPTTDTLNYPFENYLKGTYKFKDNVLTLSFSAQYIAIYTKGMSRKNVTHVEREYGESWTERLVGSKCKDLVYFIRQPEEEDDFPINYLPSPSNKTFDYYQNDLMNRGIWQKLFDNSKSDKNISEEILAKTIVFYTKQNIESNLKRTETDSTIHLAFSAKEENSEPHLNITISKIKSNYIFGDLNNDNTNDLIAMPMVDGGGSSSWNDLIVFISENNKYNLKSCTSSFDLASCKGGSHEGQFYPTKIKNGIIIGISDCYTEKDAHCCPSIKKETSVSFKNNKLTRIN